MIGIIVVSHGNISKEMVNTTLTILPSAKNIVPVTVDSDAKKETNLDVIKNAISRADNGDGVVILTDMFGGTPSNSCLPFICEGKVEVITGVNLPMLIKIASLRMEMNFKELPKFIKSYGRKNITIASDVLKGEVQDYGRNNC